MARKRRIFSPSLKAKGTLEAIKGHHTIRELCQKHQLHATQIDLWRKQLLAGPMNGVTIAVRIASFSGTRIGILLSIRSRAVAED